MGVASPSSRIGWRALVPALALGIGVAVAIVPACALGPEGIVYEKRLDLGRNPAPPPAPSAPSSNAGGEGGPVTRVVGGTEAEPGGWKSVLHIRYRRAYIDRGTGKAYEADGTCGATAIDSRWVLTAAHCLFERKLGGLESLQWATAYAGSPYSSAHPERGRTVRVEEVHVHRQFRAVSRQLINDVALLKLENDTAVPPQKLVAYRGRSGGVAEGNMATVVGWGNTSADPLEPHLASPVLLQATVPIAARQTCHRLYPDIGEAAFCAGYAEGRIDSCRGDSGGPLFVAGKNGEALQAGIVSFGRGCGRADTYGVYANVGHFEQWIRERVPAVQFVLPTSAGPGSPVVQIAAGEPADPPAPSAHIAGFAAGPSVVRAATREEMARDLAPAQKALFRLGGLTPESGPAVDAWVDNPNLVYRVGQQLRIFVRPKQASYVTVLNVGSSGRVSVIFPNFYQRDARVGAGRTVSIPADTARWRIEAAGPPGVEVIKIIASKGPLDLPELQRLASATADQPTLSLGRLGEEVARDLAPQIEHPTDGPGILPGGVWSLLVRIVPRGGTL